jgi:predicted DCC family thiol-disulfide oxidoreductase YuxK
MSEMTHDAAAAAEIYYDGACPVCRAEIAQYRRMRGADAADWRDVTTGAAPPEIGSAAVLARFHVRRRDGALVSGFRAFLAVWRLNPLLAPAARLLDRAPFI